MLLLGESESIELKADAKLRINSEQFSLSVWKILITRPWFLFALKNGNAYLVRGGINDMLATKGSRDPFGSAHHLSWVIIFYKWSSENRFFSTDPSLGRK